VKTLLRFLLNPRLTMERNERAKLLRILRSDSNDFDRAVARNMTAFFPIKRPTP
jgi:hypothetical protein